MDVIEALNARHSVRAFRPDPLDEELVVDIMEAAGRTASWANTQPWEVFVAAGAALERLRERCALRIDGGAEREPDLAIPRDWPAELEQRMVELRVTRFNALGADPGDAGVGRQIAEQNRGFFGAPAVAYLCMDRSLSPWSIFDIGMLAQSIMLAATHFGVGTIPAFNLVAYPDTIRAELGIPGNLLVIIGIAMGYEDEDSPHNHYRSPRRAVTEVIRYRG